MVKKHAAALLKRYGREHRDLVMGYYREHLDLLPERKMTIGNVVPVPFEDQFVTWVEESVAPGVTQGSFRAYKSDLATFFRDRMNFADKIRAASNHNCKSSSDPDGRSGGKKRKRKGLTDAELDAIAGYCRLRKGKHDALVTSLLECGRLLGLRPVEWVSVQIVPSTEARQGVAFVVSNAKNSMGRSHGETRTLLATNLTDDEMATIRGLVARARAKNRAWRDEVKNAGRRLNTIVQRLWPKVREDSRIRLYSARHQFGADAKRHRPRFDLVQIAAMMGHASIVSANRHYLSWHFGRKSPRLFRVMPCRGDVERVRDLNKDRPRKEFENPFATPRRNPLAAMTSNDIERYRERNKMHSDNRDDVPKAVRMNLKPK